MVAETTRFMTTCAEVKLYGFVGDLSVPTRFSLELPGSLSLREVLEKIVCALGNRVRQRLFTAAGELGPGVRVFVGGLALRSLDECLPDSSSVPIKIVVLNAAAGG